MAVLLGLAVALTYGAADFLGGLASKRSSTAAVVLVSQSVGLVLLALLVAAVGGQRPARGDLLLGVAAGTASGAGVTLLYAGLARGRMSLVAPVTGVGAAVVPFAWGIGRGERPSAASVAGVVLALAGVVLVSRTAPAGRDTAPAGRAGLGLAVGAGLAFGAVFIVLGETAAAAGLWPILTGRTTVVLLVLVALLAAPAARRRRSQRLELAPGSLPLVGATGALDVTANALYLVAVRQGLLSLVAVLSALYPAATVLLARVVLGERLAAGQRLGLVLAAAGHRRVTAG